VIEAIDEFRRKSQWENELARDSKASEARGRDLDLRVAQRLGLVVAAPIEISAPISQRRKHEGSRA
jgi:hypothetical protein